MIFFFATFSFTPPLLMMIIGVATVSHIRLARVPITTTTTAAAAPVGQLNKKDHQLITMLLFQLIATIAGTLPHALQKLYAIFTVNDTKTPLRTAVENALPQITRQLLYINASISFYL